MEIQLIMNQKGTPERSQIMLEIIFNLQQCVLKLPFLLLVETFVCSEKLVLEVGTVFIKTSNYMAPLARNLRTGSLPAWLYSWVPKGMRRH